MWTRVSLWLMRQDAAYRLDDRDGWLFRLVDGAGAPFSWKGVDYTAGVPASAPGYLDYELPPGTYVVWAERTQGQEPEDTHRAVLAVHDESQVVVRLLPRPRVKPCDHEPDPHHECRLEVLGVRGDKVREETPGRLLVVGTADGCAEVHVVVERDGQVLEDTVMVEADGSWVAAFRNELKVSCGGVVVVTATCVEDERCRAKGEWPVDCDRPKRKPSPASRKG